MNTLRRRRKETNSVPIHQTIPVVSLTAYNIEVLQRLPHRSKYLCYKYDCCFPHSTTTPVQCYQSITILHFQNPFNPICYEHSSRPYKNTQRSKHSQTTSRLPLCCRRSDSVCFFQIPTISVISLHLYLHMLIHTGPQLIEHTPTKTFNLGWDVLPTNYSIK